LSSPTVAAHMFCLNIPKIRKEEQIFLKSCVLSCLSIYLFFRKKERKKRKKKKKKKHVFSKYSEKKGRMYIYNLFIFMSILYFELFVHVFVLRKKK
jgi:hypothetical protein